jgi:hypothetical protein
MTLAYDGPSRMRDLAPIAAMLCLLATAACSADIGEPVETVIVQDAGAGGDADASPAGRAGPGVACTRDTECQSNLCFIGNTGSYCSFSCTPTDAMTTCTAPPFNGVCNKQGFCRRP